MLIIFGRFEIYSYRRTKYAEDIVLLTMMKMLFLWILVLPSSIAWTRPPNNIRKPPPLEAIMNRNEPTSESLLPSSSGEYALYTLPPALGVTSFWLYTDISKAFHELIDVASGHSWTVADGGKFMADIVRPILNGPVTLSLSILLGTLVAMTISTLYQRQLTLYRVLISTVEEIHELLLVVNGLPEPYSSALKDMFRTYLTESFQDFANNKATVDTFRRKEITQARLMLNTMSQEAATTTTSCPGSLVDELYGGLSRLKSLRAEYIAALQTQFAPLHYGNIAVLIFTLLFVFLLETDVAALQFLLDFQLSICFGLLVGSFTMLGVIIADLATPFSGVFSAMSSSNIDMDRLVAYAMEAETVASD